jgi:hypothetical protein
MSSILELADQHVKNCFVNCQHVVNKKSWTIIEMVLSHNEMRHAFYFRGQSISELRLRDVITRSQRARDFLTQVTCHREVQVALRRLVPGYQTGRSNEYKFNCTVYLCVYLYFRGDSFSELRLRDAINRSRRAQDFLTQVSCWQGSSWRWWWWLSSPWCSSLPWQTSFSWWASLPWRAGLPGRTSLPWRTTFGWRPSFVWHSSTIK